MFWRKREKLKRFHKAFLPALAFLANPAFWGGAAKVGGILGGLFGRKKKGGERVNIEAMLPSWYNSTMKSLSGFANKYMSGYVPGEAFPGGIPQYAPSSQEETGLNQLTQFLKNPNVGQLFLSGRKQLQDTLSGKYSDPRKSPYISAISDLEKLNRNDAITTSRRRQGARGSYFTRSAIREEGDITNRSLANLNAIIGEFINRERGRQVSAVSPALEYDRYQNITAPLSKIGASQTYGPLQRLIEQSNFERRYNDFIRQRKEKALPFSVGKAVIGQPTYPTSLQMPYREGTSSMGNILKLLSQGGQNSILNMIGGLFNRN